MMYADMQNIQHFSEILISKYNMLMQTVNTYSVNLFLNLYTLVYHFIVDLNFWTNHDW